MESSPRKSFVNPHNDGGSIDGGPGHLRGPKPQGQTSVILGLKQKLRNRFNVSVAEVEYANAAKRSRLGIVMVTSESRPLHSQLDKIVEMVRRTNGLTLVDYSREWV